MPLKMLGHWTSAEPDPGASASGQELRGSGDWDPKTDKCCGHTVASSIVSPYNYLRAPNFIIELFCNH